MSNPFADMVSVEPVGHHPYPIIMDDLPGPHPKTDHYFKEFDGMSLETVGNDNEEHVLVPMSVFRALERDERELIALNSAGVDNWSGREYVNWDYVDSGEGEPCRD
jgi:hypothetical protein